jgi:hypothetical protein
VKLPGFGTASPDKKPGARLFFLIAALAIVLAFAGSLIFGLRGSHEPEPGREPKAPSAVVHDTRVKVEVQNGSGKSGLARMATQQLRDAGFDVVQFGNAGKVTDVSIVLDRVGRPDVANDVRKALGISGMRTAIDTSRYVDVTVILGKDWPPVKSVN